MRHEQKPEGASSRSILSFKDYQDLRGGRKEEDIENWLKEEVERQYGKADEVIMRNPLIRLSVIFEALGEGAKIQLYRYTEKVILEQGKEMTQKDRFWHLLEKGGTGTWKSIEEYADTLVCKNLL